MSTGITRDELLAEYERLAQADPRRAEGHTTRELEELLGCGSKDVLRFLHAMQRAGRLRPIRVLRPCLDGIPRPTTVYRIVAA